MKVLWFVQSDYNPSNKNNLYNGVGWILSLQRELLKIDNLELSMAYWGSSDKSYKKDGISFWEMAEPHMNTLKKVSLRLKGNIKQEAEYLWNSYSSKMLDVIQKISPEVIHVFGSENMYGLISKYTDIPVIIHLQGILNPYYVALLPPGISKSSYILKDGCNPIKVFKNYNSLYCWKKNIYCEKEILSHTNFFFGRTVWDYRISKLFNPQAKYLQCGEVLRESFYEEKQREVPSTLVIVSTISSPFYKGYDLVLKTAKILRVMNIGFEWLLFGNIKPSFIEEILGMKHDDVHVHLLGVATEKQIQSQLLKSTLYVHPSYIDNSPNSVCEAQMCGLPVIATNVGGVCSIVKDGETGFLVPANDPYQMAYLIIKLFKDKNLNIRVGKEARKTAEKRHNKSTIIKQLLDGYLQMIK